MRERQDRLRPKGRAHGVLPDGPGRQRDGATPPLIGHSPVIREVHRQIRLLAPSPMTVLIQGETGTGKGVVAQLLHEASGRHSFHAVNVAAIARELCESELFGHVKGAFTGADRHRLGIFQTAQGGTVFLDEIGKLTPELQAKLLTVLEEGQIRPVGADERRRVDVRIIAATNEHIEQGVEEGWFRPDLYYRLRGAKIYLSPLRERRGDIAELVAFFGRGHPIVEKVMGLLMAYDWPGNVRELQRTVENSILFAAGGAVLAEHLPEEIRNFDAAGVREREIRRAARSIGSRLAQTGGSELREIMAVIEYEIIRTALSILGGTREATAKRLGMSTRTLTRKLNKRGWDGELPK